MLLFTVLKGSHDACQEKRTCVRHVLFISTFSQTLDTCLKVMEISANGFNIGYRHMVVEDDKWLLKNGIAVQRLGKRQAV
ncbi:hypothetical protein L1987_29850 [Smallanthus sonchifolius]|uniref:Uncharacterized protein n=1 Tax=Smallanthus sonchifolius TaxID=185202 RepID=A0ACB9I2F8_9ASTR|nr:hypothetical protein L1987_29850 [Smallanthus sonchifolius]